MEKNEREWIFKIKKGEVCKNELITRIMIQANTKPKLNPMASVKEFRYWTTKDGKKEMLKKLDC